jgi:pilus assembly protein CpaF
MENPMVDDSLTLQNSSIIKLKAYLINIITREDNQISASPAERLEVVQEILTKAYEQTGVKLPESLRAPLFRDILADLIGFGPIQPLLDDPEISEVMVNSPKKVYIERKGKIIDSGVTFDNDEHIMRVIERIISPLGRRVDYDSPMVDARLPDGSRVNADPTGRHR